MPFYLVVWAELVVERGDYPGLRYEETKDEERMAELVDQHFPGCLVIRDAELYQVTVEHKVIPKLILTAGPEIRKAAKEEASKMKGEGDGP